MVVAQLVERSLPTPEGRGWNPVIGEILFNVNCIEKTKLKIKRTGMANFFLKKVREIICREKHSKVCRLDKFIFTKPKALCIIK